MIEIKRILCPIDFSCHSRRALQYAMAMARWYGAHVGVLHVLAPALAAVYPPIQMASEPLAAEIADREALAAEVKRVVDSVDATGVTFDVAVRQGLPATEILAHAASINADLLVVGTHGRSGFERFLLGSVAERLLHSASCAVMTVPNQAPVAPAVLVKNILCAVDFSDYSLAALRHAILLAEEADARLVALHVVAHELDDLSELTVASTGSGHMTTEEFRRQRDDQLRADIERLLPGQARTYCSIETRLAHGKPWREILRAAANQTADLIVMGVHGRGAADLAVFGSTTQHVVRQATCPVLTLRDRRLDECEPFAEAVDE